SGLHTLLPLSDRAKNGRASHRWHAQLSRGNQQGADHSADFVVLAKSMITAKEQDRVKGKSDAVAFWKIAYQSRAYLEGDRAAEKELQGTVKRIEVCLLTGGDDRPYALGMASTLASRAISVDFIGSDKLDAPELHRRPLIAFLNLRGDQSEDAPFRRKFVRILTYYVRLLKYVLRSRPRIFHILWNNKFEHFDRTLLMLYYRLFGKRI